MSDLAVLRLVEEMEGLLTEPDALELGHLEAWNRRFNEAAVLAERGPGWSAIVARAHALGGRVGRVVEQLGEHGRAMRGEMAVQARGTRALKGYGSF